MSRGNANAQKARGRARTGNNSGSALEQTRAILAMDAKNWEDIEAEAEHLADFAGLIQQGSIMSNGGLSATIACPMEYSPRVLEVVTLGRIGVVYFRAYVVPLSVMTTEPEPDSDHGD